jgi:uncharacterized protein VirK/YbjX
MRMTNIPGKQWNEAHRNLLWELKSVLEAGFAGEAGYADVLQQWLDKKAQLTSSTRYYLARAFDADKKLICMRRHFGWALERLGPAGLHKLIAAPQPLWRFEADGLSYSVWARAEFWVAREGEISLEMFLSDEISLGILTFSAVPGELFGLAATDAFLLSRIQGRPEVFEQIRVATKAMSEVAPRALLMAALAGVAKAMGVRHIVGVDAGNYVAFLPENREMLERVYDDFFKSLDAEAPIDGFYHLDLEAPPKPVTQQKVGHRTRTRRKRQFKADATETVAESWTRMCARLSS